MPLWSLNDRKKSTKTGKNFRGGREEFFWLANIYTPAVGGGRFSPHFFPDSTKLYFINSLIFRFWSE